MTQADTGKEENIKCMALRPISFASGNQNIEDNVIRGRLLWQGSDCCGFSLTLMLTLEKLIIVSIIWLFC